MHGQPDVLIRTVKGYPFDAVMANIYPNAPKLGTYVCRQCDKCLICPENIPLTTIFRYEGYYDRQLGDGTVTNASHYAFKDRLRLWSV